ncbi:hypothetical protein [Alteraurantiacibacter aquimixticola]|uniref:CobQ/CobB/MinD/ParA nucleotide binding domain-containing protein n=1 Tax=Alteraurantiacibacter aquimixticola TaxID=2489173 RepID=A0A4T3F4R9_9SPHN|nr:hypothetical protein [Alteraurantiacibacter aquimixticola]TIX50498.1 hypothetical protein E5222_09520 [Alteraurantiacibacter aquimixticola]
MNAAQKLYFILIVSNAGGEGKTLIAEVIKALFQLSGERVSLLDADAGNGAARVSDSSARSVGWGVGAITAPNILDACREQNVILDLGANSLASQREIVELIPALRDGFVSAGYNALALLPITPLKLGAADAILNLAAKIDGFEKVFIRNDRNNTRQFDERFYRTNAAQLGYLQPGFIAYLRGRDSSMSEAVLAPSQNYRLAAHCIAAWMRDFAEEPALKGMFEPALTRLKSLPPPPSPLAYSINSLTSATDDALESNVTKTRILASIDEHGWHPAGLRKVADELTRAAS